jgi:hypothetical protein
MVGSSVTVMSESAYLFFTLIVLTLFDSWRDKMEGANYSLIILIAAIAVYAQLIRTVGISILAALLIYFLMTRHFREAGITLGVFVLGGLLQAWLNLRNGGSVVSAGYQAQVFNSSIIQKIGQMWANILGYFNEIAAGSLIPVFGEKFTSLAGPMLPLLANTSIIFLIILGLILSLKKPHLVELYFLIYVLAILAFWNPRVGSVKVRFLFPVIPFLYFYLLLGFRWIINKLSKNRAAYEKGIISGITAFILLLLLARNLQDWRSPLRDQMTDLSIGTEWISKHAAPDAIIMVNEPVPAYIHAQRKTIAFPDHGQDVEKYLDNQGIDYVVISPKLQSPRSTLLDTFTENQLLPILKSNPDKFSVVYKNLKNNVTVYKYLGGPSNP